jgi:hypothetical protein
MNRWLSTSTATGVGWFLIGVGLLPLGCLLAWAHTHSSEPLSVQLSLQRGQFVSPYFEPELDGTYQISLYWPKFPSRQTQVDLDWQIVDSKDVTIEQGTYDSALGGANIVGLGEYVPQRGVRQRIIVNVHQDVDGPDGEARLEIGIPEVGLERAEGAYPLVMMWAAVMTGLGVILLAVSKWRRGHSQ